MTDKILRTQFKHVFSTTAARLAYVFSADDVGNVVVDLETSVTYFVASGGTGVAALTRASANSTICIPISLTDLVEIDSSGDVGAAAAAGGRLAADTSPILRGDTAEDFEVAWATGNVDPVGFHLSLPLDISGVSLLDDTRDVLVKFLVASGTTDAFGITVESSFNGAALASDTASDTATKSATAHIITATIAAADVPALAKTLTVALTPTAAHATNAYLLKGIWVIGYSK